MFLEFPEKFARSGDHAKANYYSADIHKVMNNGDFSLGPFKTMVKSGEIFMTTESFENYPICFDEDSRPRNVMIPQGPGARFRAAVQASLWQYVKQIPGFIQGMTTTQIEHEINDNDFNYSISIDGHAFDSTQYA